MNLVLVLYSILQDVTQRDQIHGHQHMKVPLMMLEIDQLRAQYSDFLIECRQNKEYGISAAFALIEFRRQLQSC